MFIHDYEFLVVYRQRERERTERARNTPGDARARRRSGHATPPKPTPREGEASCRPGTEQASGESRGATD